MSTNFEFNAPQYINFSDIDDPKADKFFDINIPQETNVKDNMYSSKKSNAGQINKLANTENRDPCIVSKSEISSCDKKPVIRKVLHEIVNVRPIVPNESSAVSQSKDQEQDIAEHFEKLQLSESKSKKSRIPIKATEVFSSTKNIGSARKSHQMTTRLDKKNQSCHGSANSINSLHYEDESNAVSVNQVSSTESSNYVKRTGIKRNASPLSSTKKFISLAEQVEHFYKDTPERYRSKPNKHSVANRNSWLSKSKCIPKTPNLTTKFRARKINFPNKEEREEMELDEIKKHQIKAHPLNEKILMGPSLNLKAPVIKKGPTIPQPFSLTEFKKKEAPQEPVFQFKAQPVPTAILNGPVGIPPKKVATPTVPNTPQIRVPLRFRVEAKTPDVNTSNNSLNLPQRTKVEPFSFDSKIKEMLLKKEEFVKKVIEEEKKTFNSFKAHPMPSFKAKTDQGPKIEKPHTTVPQPFNLTQPKGNKSFSEEPAVSTPRVTPFKARPAAVVHQKPFVPKLEKHEVLLPSEFHLNTEKRAAERLKFDEKIKQKEEENAMILKLQKEEEERLEMERIKEERKKAEFKAKPVPKYKVIEIHAADPDKLTRPQSPLFFSKLREAKKEKQSSGDC